MNAQRQKQPPHSFLLMIKTASLFLLLSLTNSAFASAAENYSIYLLRHAEKQKEKDNPELTETGIQRANHLVTLLKDKKLTAIYSTNYNRTQQTAAPLAKALKMDLNSYDPKKLAEFASELKAKHQTAVVVGHSNTTPELVFHLGGDFVNDIDESEYDRVYRLDFKQGKVETTILRSTPTQNKKEASQLLFNLSGFLSMTNTYQMKYGDKVVGKSIHSLAKDDKNFRLHESTTIEAMKIDAKIKVLANVEDFSPLSMQMSGSMGAPSEIDLSWTDGVVKGKTLMPRANYKPKGVINVDRKMPSHTFERTSVIMLAHLIDVEPQKPYFIKWFNGYDNLISPIEISSIGEAKVTVPAGSFDTRVIRLQGGAPSQLFYISKGEHPKVVKIEVISTPWRYELVESKLID